MWVVKVGGSLLETCDLSKLLHDMADHGEGKLVIVPGGGVFADQVRFLQQELKIDDATAHRMALRAMEQFGELLVSMDPRLHAANTLESINDWLNMGAIPVWYPYDMVAYNPVVKASWDITSDSLALWLAHSMKCQNLALLKPTVPEDEDYSAMHLSQLGYVDNGFVELMTDMIVRPWWLFYEQMDSFYNLLDHADGTADGMKEIVYKKS